MVFSHLLVRLRHYHVRLISLLAMQASGYFEPTRAGCALALTRFLVGFLALRRPGAFGQADAGEAFFSAVLVWGAAACVDCLQVTRGVPAEAPCMPAQTAYR